MTNEEHQQIIDMLAPLAVHAVEPDEAAVVYAHLDTCDSCKAELDAFRETAGLLGSDPSLAPDELWDRISTELGATPPPLDLAKVRTARATKTSRTSWLGWGVAAALAGLLAVGTGTVIAQNGDTGLTGAEQQLADSARSEPGAKTVLLMSTEGPAMAEVVMLSDGRGYIVNKALPELPQDRAYQLWAISGGKTISAGVLGPDPSIATFTTTPDVKAIAITDEVSGGVERSSNAPIATGAMSEPA